MTRTPSTYRPALSAWLRRPPAAAQNAAVLVVVKGSRPLTTTARHGTTGRYGEPKERSAHARAPGGVLILPAP